MPVADSDSAPPACRVCFARTTTPYCQKEQASYFICEKCALIFQHPLPTSRSMATWADTEYASGAYHDYVAARPMKMRHFDERLNDVADVVKPGRLLDVGCSLVYFLEVS
jgi:hypothetical protein